MNQAMNDMNEKVQLDGMVGLMFAPSSKERQLNSGLFVR